MLDLLMLVLVAALFVAAWGLAWLCEWVRPK
jgi:hypothetical protein